MTEVAPGIHPLRLGAHGVNAEAAVGRRDYCLGEIEGRAASGWGTQPELLPKRALPKMQGGVIGSGGTGSSFVHPLAIISHRTETCPTQIADAQVCQCEAAGAGPDGRPFDDSSFLSRQGGVQF